MRKIFYQRERERALQIDSLLQSLLFTKKEIKIITDENEVKKCFPSVFQFLYLNNSFYNFT